MLFDHLLVHTVALGQRCRRLQHAILQVEHLLQRIVEKGRRESHRVGSTVVQSHFQLPRPLLLLLLTSLRLHLRLCFGWLGPARGGG